MFKLYEFNKDFISFIYFYKLANMQITLRHGFKMKTRT